MSFSFGASTFIWTSPFSDEIADHVALHVKELGFDILEICVEDPAILSADGVGAAAEKADVGVSVCGAFGPQRDVSHEDPDIRRSGIDYLKTCVDLAAAAGSPHVAGPMFSATGKARLLPEEEREQQRTWAAESLREVAAYAGERSVRLAIEPLNRFETDLVNTVEQGLDLCDRISEVNVGLLLDTFHMNIEEKSLADAIVQAGDRVFHFHTCENDRGTPGSGHVEWQDVFAALERIGYDGALVIESFTPAIKQIARAVSMWRPLAASEDELAREGIAFLREQAAAVR
jgi:D-psicose/D-tagatose/L-ribulose 3-epimerase